MPIAVWNAAKAPSRRDPETKRSVAWTLNWKSTSASVIAPRNTSSATLRR